MQILTVRGSRKPIFNQNHLTLRRYKEISRVRNV